MKVLFCNIAWMKYYRGTYPGDEPLHGGAWVEEHHDANEALNFLPITVTMLDTNEETEIVLGSFETKSTNGTQNQLHIEKIEGCSDLRKDESVEGVLVIWCASSPKGGSRVVGWYKNATVYRYYEELDVEEDDGNEFTRVYNVSAMSCDAVLLPEDEREHDIWHVPRINTKRGFPFGFFRSNVWYPKENAKDFVKRLRQNIDAYNGQNVLNMDVD